MRPPVKSAGNQRGPTLRKQSGRGINSPGDDQSFEIALKCLEAINTPTSLSVYLLIKYNEWDQIANKSVDPLHYLHPHAFADDYLSVNILRKASHLRTSFDREEVAIRNFFDVEEHVRKVNRDLIGLRWHPNRDLKRSDLISRAARICHRILGSSPGASKIAAELGFGPGASSSCRRSSGHAYGKLRSRLDVTPQLLQFSHHIVNAIPLWPKEILQSTGPASVLASAMTVVRGAKIEAVPKDAKTHRVIAVEPHVNITIQRAMGKLIERKLKLYGIDLHDQGANQKLAKVGYDRGYSTIDLSNASDCMSRELIRDLLPPDWFAALDMIRSHSVSHKGSWYRLEKFSTAGCGFTFALETLVFFAICAAAVGKYPKAVYGDDIVVVDEAFTKTVEALNALGFQANPRKSFSVEHPFRESCGEDFFQGVGVRPFFIRGPVKTLSARISLHNQIVRYALRRNAGFGMDARFHQILRDLRGRSRLLVPYNIGDAGFAASIADAIKVGNASPLKDGHQGWFVRCLLQRPHRQVMRSFYAALYQSFTSIVSGPVIAVSAREGTPTHGEVLSGTGADWHVAPIPVMGWDATDTFEISSVSDLA